MNWRKWNRLIHRDLGYFFFGVTLIYALSGIALNHLKDWNPSYMVSNDYFTITGVNNMDDMVEADVVNMLNKYNITEEYKTHYYPTDTVCKIFLKGGSVTFDVVTGEANFEKVARRPVFYEVNILHYNPGSWWTYFSDLFCVSLILIAITGMFIVKGKYGLKWRGALLAVVGMIVPILFLI